MSEPQVFAPDDRAAFPDGASAGAQLRAAREAQGIHITSLAVALKVPASRLEALEADRFDLLPDAPFVRALAGSVCRALKLDPAPVLARLPQKTPPRLDSEVNSSSPSFRTPGARKPGVGEQLGRPVVWSVLLLLVAAAALIMLPSERLGAWMGAAKAVLHDSLSTPAAPTVVASTPVEPLSASPAAAPVPAASPEAAAPAVPPAAAPAPATTAAAAGATPAEGAGLLAFKASGESWVKVTDARGTVVLEKTLAAGNSETVNGTTPLTVIVGRADATQVTVRGQPFDIAALARTNVARFEVK